MRELIEVSKARDLSVVHVHEQKTTPKVTAKIAEVADWIIQNDPDNNLTVRDIASRIGSSVGTVHNARKHLQQNR